MTISSPVGTVTTYDFHNGVSQAERLAAAALAEPNHHAATRFLLATLPELDSPTPGLRNVGLLATQELRAGVPTRTDWPAAQGKASGLLAKRGKDLVQGLGFGVDTLGTNASMLTVAGGQRAVAVFLDEGETFDAPAGRFGTSPVSHALAIADQQNVPWVILTRSSEIRLYAARPDTGVGRKGRAETFVEANLSLLPEDQAAYLHLLFSAEALAPKGTLEEILDRSADFAADLAVRLRERVYFETVPALAQAVARRMGPDPTEADLAHAYEQVMVILFRLLFVAYAEDKELLPYRTNSRYADHSLSRIVRRLVEARHAGSEEHDTEAEDLWEDVIQLWRAVDKGQRAWGVPPYNGGLFSADPAVSEAGAALAELRLTDAEFGPALSAMLIDQGSEGFGPVDFRSLSVREFGTIYEGLLGSQLSVAPSDLTTDKKGNYVPAKSGDDALVLAGSVYFHNRSGARKDSGSYFTKPFAVEHLLDHALEPALDDHLAQLEALRDTGDDAALADAFFDFRCADIAMGSGHFLIAAVDRIEARLSAYLALNPIPAVTAELDRLRAAAYDAIGDMSDGIEIETGSSLLRRQVARRCIYGIDRNHVSVELARLAVWIHTFVPGLPLSFLDHNLVHGDSLTGIGTLAEVVQALDPGADPNAPSLFRSQIEEFLSAAERHLQRLARTADASKAEVDAARAAHLDALAAVAPARELFDLVAANRAGVGTLPEAIAPDTIRALRSSASVERTVVDLQPLHLPSAFPEVFVRENPGFDCILGNPPWEEPVVEELQFWSLRFPGLKALPNAEQKRAIEGLAHDRPDLADALQRERDFAERTRRILGAGQFPGMGVGDPDLYKAFLWRFAGLCRASGRIGVVVPRSVFAAKGSANWRLSVLPGSRTSIVFTKNRNEWLFTDVNPGYTVALVALQKEAPVPTLGVQGTYQSLAELRAGTLESPTSLDLNQLQAADELLCIPAIEDASGLRLFSILISHPPFGDKDRPDFRARPHTELHATNDAAEFFTGDPSGIPVRNHLNVGHFAFDASAGAFNFADEASAVRALQERRRSAWGKKSSPFTEMPRDWVLDDTTLPLLNPRVVVRDVVHSTNPRKVWAAVAPARTLLTNKAPYLLFPRGDLPVQAYVLGILGSSVCDWFGHLRINLNLNFFILNSIPIPRYQADERQVRLGELAASLAVRSEADKGYGAWHELRTPVDPSSAIAELDALASLIFGVPDDLLPTIWNSPSRPPLAEVQTWRKHWTA